MRKHNLDYLKVLAIFSVIGIHIFDKLITSYSLLSPNEWKAANCIESILRMAVPIFFMINGTLLLRKYEGEKAIVFYKKAFPRLLISYIVFTLISINASSQWFDAPYTTEDVWARLFHFTGFYHLWFVQTLLAIYLFVPAMRLMIRFIHRADTNYLLDAFVLIWFGASILTPFITFKFNLPEVIISSPFVTWILPYAGYFVLGYYLEYRIKPLIKNKRIALISAFVLALGGMIFTAHLTKEHLNLETNALHPYIYYAYSLNVFLTSVGVTSIFLLLEDKFKANKLIWFLSSNSLIIYLVHPLIISSLEFDYEMTVFTNNPLLGAFKMFVATTIISIVIAAIWQLIKTILKKVVIKLKRTPN